MEENNEMTTVELEFTGEDADMTNDLVEVGSDNGFGYGLAVGGTVVAIGARAYKYAVKPLAAKIKDKVRSRKQKKSNATCDCPEEKIEVVESSDAETNEK